MGYDVNPVPSSWLVTNLVFMAELLLFLLFGDIRVAFGNLLFLAFLVMFCYRCNVVLHRIPEACLLIQEPPFLSCIIDNLLVQDKNHRRTNKLLCFTMQSSYS
jgi:hypothetical protein